MMAVAAAVVTAVMVLVAAMVWAYVCSNGGEAVPLKFNVRSSFREIEKMP